MKQARDGKYAKSYRRSYGTCRITGAPISEKDGVPWALTAINAAA